MNVRVKYCEFPKGTISPVSSKSISNRALIINALTKSQCNLNNLSDSEDTITLIHLLKKLNSNDKNIELNTGPAGTVMRFLISYCCFSGKEVILTGSERMLERPIKNLIDALRKIGANISCLEKEGFAPIKISPSKIVGGKIELDASISSQFISSLLLCAPYFEKGLEIKLVGNIVSSSYIDLTIDVMKQFGVNVFFENNILKVNKGNYNSIDFVVEGDWSGASYFYSLAALSKNAEIELKGMNINSLQGDKAILSIASNFGIKTSVTENGILISKVNCIPEKKFEYNFLLCPDIAQTVVPMLAALKIEDVKLSGLNTLVLKETDRILALKNELGKFKIHFSSTEFGNINFNAIDFSPFKGLINTYQDHRMAMGFAPLAQKTGELIIENEATVKKSYIRYWQDLNSLGCIVENSDI